MPPPQADLTDLLALVHVEVEARESVQAFRPRMFEYYVQLRRDSQLPVLPIGLFLRVGLEGTGWDAYEEYFWERRLSEAAPTNDRRRGRGNRNNSVLVSVTDTGSSIAAEFHQEIFEEFVRVDPSSSGMGLGLAITKRLIQAHRGKVWVDSVTGSGSTFSFLLPINVE